MKKKKIANGTVKSEVASALSVNPDYTAPELKRIVEKALKAKGFNYRFTVRTYLNIKKRLAPNLGLRPMDSPWSTGACLKYQIPPQNIPHLVELQRLNAKSGGKFPVTIRMARWFALHHEAIETLVDALEPKASPLQRLGYHSMVADQFAERERISEILGQGHPDTSDLDKQYFIEQNLDLTAGFAMSYFPEKYDQDKQSLENFKPLSSTEVEPVLGRLTQEQMTLLNE